MGGKKTKAKSKVNAASFGSRVEEIGGGSQRMAAIGESGPSKRRKTKSKGESKPPSDATSRRKKKSVFFGNFNTSRHVGDKAGAFWLSNCKRPRRDFRSLKTPTSYANPDPHT